MFVATNQGGIALGFLTEEFLRNLHGELNAFVEAGGARVDGWFFCPHHPRAAIDALRSPCPCRKPGPGMVHQAMEQFDIDLSRSFVVGDTSKDMRMAEAVGARAVLVRTGLGELQLARNAHEMPAEMHVTDTLAEATSWILRESGHPLERPA